MSRSIKATICAGLAVATFASSFAPPSRAVAQTTATGTRSTAIGVVNGNVVVIGPSNAKLADLARKLDGLRKKGGLTDNELKTLIDTVNSTVVPMLASIKDDTARIDENTRRIEEKLDDLLNRLKIANEYPNTARDVLRPFLQPELDLSNKTYSINEFLDSNAANTYTVTFALTGQCSLFIHAPQRTGFGLRWAVLSPSGSEIEHSLQGTQSRTLRPIPLSTGIYQFQIVMTRDAGQIVGDISARCQ